MTMKRSNQQSSVQLLSLEEIERNFKAIKPEEYAVSGLLGGGRGGSASGLLGKGGSASGLLGGGGKGASASGLLGGRGGTGASASGLLGSRGVGG
jgi:hypothetical protein